MAVVTQDPSALSFTPANIQAIARALVNANIIEIPGQGAPINGPIGTGTGAGVAGKGSVYFDTNTGDQYSNVGTLASPVWVTSTSTRLGQVLQFQLTNAQIKSLRATPVTLVPAPGVGFFINPTDCVLELVYGGNNAFTANAGDNLALKWQNGTTPAILQGGIQAFLQATNSAFNPFTSQATGSDINVAKANVDNQPLVIHNIGAAEIAGNAANDNTIRVTLLFTTSPSF